ncbi:hypothetical protein [Noviluteimonas dokdonensis]|nr:hypothetical protein [Lysobacter dokdonensis]
MHYTSGQSVLPGDRVAADGLKGKVVAVIDDNLYAPDYPAAEWSYLGEGLIIETEEIGVLHLPTMGEDIVLIARLMDTAHG